MYICVYEIIIKICKAIKEIKAYKLTDGSIIEDKDKAIKLQNIINFEKAILDFSEREGNYDTKDAIYYSIVNNKNELLAIFNLLN